MHVVTEADSNRDLAKGMQGWEIRVARRVNARLGWKGKVFADRFSSAWHFTGWTHDRWREGRVGGEVGAGAAVRLGVGPCVAPRLQ